LTVFMVNPLRRAISLRTQPSQGATPALPAVQPVELTRTFPGFPKSARVADWQECGASGSEPSRHSGGKYPGDAIPELESGVFPRDSAFSRFFFFFLFEFLGIPNRSSRSDATSKSTLTRIDPRRH